MATLAIAAAAIPAKLDHSCHNVTESATRPETIQDAAQLYGPVPAVAAVAAAALTTADSTVHRASDASVDRMPRDHAYVQPSLGGHGKDEPRRHSTSADYKYPTASPIHALHH